MAFHSFEAKNISSNNIKNNTSTVPLSSIESFQQSRLLIYNDKCVDTCNIQRRKTFPSNSYKNTNDDVSKVNFKLQLNHS